MKPAQLLAALSTKDLNKLLLIGLPVVAGVLWILGLQDAHRHQALEMRQWLTTLTARDVVRVLITPVDTAAVPGTHPPTTVITDSATTQKLLAAYQHAGSYGPGGGRLSGWQAQVDFHLRTGQIVYSTIYKNDYASLLLITTDSSARTGSSADYLMSQTAGQLVQNLSRARR